MHLDTSFQTAIEGVVLAQPLYVERGVGGAATLYVATEQNNVYALDATTGATLWMQHVAAPVPPASLLC
jgi:outer membrane protein assembly factor BamB